MIYFQLRDLFSEISESTFTKLTSRAEIRTSANNPAVKIAKQAVHGQNIIRVQFVA